MIVDSIQNSSKYTSIHPLFAKAFDYIHNTDLSALEIGKFDIDGDHYLNGEVIRLDGAIRLTAK